MIEINVKISTYAFYRQSTKEWVVNANVITDRTALSVDFTDKKLKKAKKKFCKWCSKGIVGVEMERRLREHEVEIPVITKEGLGWC